jgi:3-oxoacyl-[acyl-carrier protein] reductase
MTADRNALAGRHALVTGAGTGIGRGEAQALAALGARVVVQDIRADVAHETADLIRTAGGDAEPLVCDVADLDAMRPAIEVAEDAGRGFDILVNNAGMGQFRAVEDVTPEDFDRMVAINVRAPFFLAQAVIPGMKRRRWGRIVNISSVVGVRGWANNTHYAGTKMALIGFARAWALEFAPYGITANTVCPTMTRTEMATRSMTEADLAAFAAANPMQRLALPEDVANLVAFLCLPQSGFITGQTVSPNGGSFVGAM